MFLHLLYKFIENNLMLLFYINLGITLLLSILLISLRKTKKKKIEKLKKGLTDVTKTVNSIRYGDLTKKIQKHDFPESKKMIESINRMIEALHDREIMLAESQTELERQNKLLKTVIDSLSDGLIILDETKKILQISTNIQKWFNKNGSEIKGKYIDDYINVPSKKPVDVLKNEAVKIIADAPSSYTATTVEINNEENKKGYILILRNITEQLELEAMKEDFVATLTHDLKVPIIAETNMLELFLSENFGEISEKQRIALQKMQLSNKELLNLVQIVLDTYKVKDGKITLYKENILLKSFINEIIEEMQIIAQKNENEINFVLDRDIRVFADRIQLKRVMKNLIQNAILYSETKTPITITIGEIPGYVIIKIKDKGSGISKEYLDKIFDRYYSVARKFKKIGTGLGLYLSHQIIKAHKGNLTVESKEGEFTEFCITIPVINYEQSFM